MYLWYSCMCPGFDRPGSWNKKQEGGLDVNLVVPSTMVHSSAVDRLREKAKTFMHPQPEAVSLQPQDNVRTITDVSSYRSYWEGYNCVLLKLNKVLIVSHLEGYSFIILYAIICYSSSMLRFVNHIKCLESFGLGGGCYNMHWCVNLLQLCY